MSYGAVCFLKNIKLFDRIKEDIKDLPLSHQTFIWNKSNTKMFHFPIDLSVKSELHRVLVWVCVCVCVCCKCVLNIDYRVLPQIILNSPEKTPVKKCIQDSSLQLFDFKAFALNTRVFQATGLNNH